MRKFILLICLLGMATIFAGCEDKPVNDPTQTAPTIKLEQSTIEISAEGGTFAVGYTLTNAFDGIDIVATSDAPWITDIKTTPTNITFSVDQSDEKAERAGVITIKYPGLSAPADLIVKQAFFTTELFEINISDLTSSSFVSNIIPRDKDLTYVVYVSAMSYLFEVGINSEEALFMDDKTYFTNLAAQYNTNLGQFMIANRLCQTGDSSVQWTGVTPTEEYVVYVYAIEFNEDMTDYSISSSVYYDIVKPAKAPLSDIEFTFNYDIQGPVITHTITPVNWDGAFFYEYFPEGSAYFYPEDEAVTEEYIDTVVTDWLSLVNAYLSSGYSAEGFVDMACMYGTYSLKNTLTANTKYMAQAYAIDIVDGIPQVVSTPKLAYFTTGNVETSDMTFKLTVENLYARVADVQIAPSNDSDPYTVLVVERGDIAGETNEEIMMWALNTFNLSLYNGTITSHLNTLKPETDYAMLAFGYYGGVITTDLARYDFTTEAAAAGENEVLNITNMGPYSPRALAEYDPENYGHLAMYEEYGYVLFWSEVEVKTPTPDIFYNFYTLDTLMYGDEYIISDLTSYGATPSQTMFTGRGEVTFAMCGVAMDYRGNYSPVYYGEPFTYNSADFRPFEELKEKITSNGTRSSSLMLGNPDGSCQSVSLSHTLTHPLKRTAPLKQSVVYDTNTTTLDIDKSKPYKGFMPVALN